MIISEEDKKRLQKCQLLLLLELRRVCNKYEINYSLLFGTLLGAVRHQGIIPWDHDIDVGMLREDYTKFTKACNKELSSAFFLQDSKTEKYHIDVPSRLMLNDTIFHDARIQYFNIQHKISIDIYIFDNSPNDKKLQERQQEDFSLLWIKRKVAQNLRNQKRLQTLPQLTSISDRIRRWRVITFYNFSLLTKLITYKLQKYNSTTTENVVIAGGMFIFSKTRIPKILFENLISLQFEGFKFLCISNYHIFLTQMYGEYMIPTIKSERDKEFPVLVELDFGKYQDIDLLLKEINKYKSDL